MTKFLDGKALAQQIRAEVAAGVQQIVNAGGRPPGLAAVLVGGREQVKVLVTVRDLRDVLASFERLYRLTSALGQLPQAP